MGDDDAVFPPRRFDEPPVTDERQREDDEESNPACISGSNRAWIIGGSATPRAASARRAVAKLSREPSTMTTPASGAISRRTSNVRGNEAAADHEHGANVVRDALFLEQRDERLGMHADDPALEEA